MSELLTIEPPTSMSPYYDYDENDRQWMSELGLLVKKYTNIPKFNLPDWYNVDRSEPTNPYHKVLKKITYVDRAKAVWHYAWAVPNEGSIATIVREAAGREIVEICAGSGYWGALINDAGGKITCYDIDPWPVRHYPVSVGSSEKLENSKDKCLFLCWPPYDMPIGYECLQAFDGDTLFYVGEGYGGCTADDDFHSLLNDAWKEVVDFTIPQHDGLHDRLFVYRRKV